MNKKMLVGIAVIIVIFVGWYLLSSDTAKAPEAKTSVTNQMPIAGSVASEKTVENTASSFTVMYTDSGFSPKDIAVPLGTTVIFLNKSSGNMWVASGPHPAHTLYNGTSLSQHCPDTTNTAFDECVAVASNNEFSFTFNKEGIWKYHNHVDASKTGAITVTAQTTAQ